MSVTAYYSGNEEINRPVYDIEDFKQYIKEQDISKAEITDLITLRERPVTEKKGLPLQLIFNILIVIIALVLLVVIVLKLKPRK